MKKVLLVVLFLALAGSAFAQTSHSTLLTWTASTSNGVAGYNVYRVAGSCPASGSPAGAVKLNAVFIAANSFTDFTITLGQTYCYYGTAVNTLGVESSASNTAGATFPDTPQAQTGFKATVQ